MFLDLAFQMKINYFESLIADQNYTKLNLFRKKENNQRQFNLL